MSKFYIYSDGAEFPAQRAEQLAEAVSSFVQADVPLAIEFIFVDEAEIRRLNSEIRGIDKVTDVLSFPTLDGVKGREIKGEEHPFDFDEQDNLLIGSVAVCCGRARSQAEEYGHSYERELHYLLVHGIMHCLGYDHETEDERAEMREKEEFVLNKLGIARE